MTAIDIITKQDLELFKQELFAKLEEIKTPNNDQSGQWLRSAEVRQLLNISPGTLQNFRIEGVLKPSKIGKIFYYKRSDILAVLERNRAKGERWEK